MPRYVRDVADESGKRCLQHKNIPGFESSTRMQMVLSLHLLSMIVRKTPEGRKSYRKAGLKLNKARK